MKSRLLWWLLCFWIGKAEAQNTIALPEIVNYAKQSYHAGMQNWKICQDENGIMYFANNEGLLSFDGNFWKKYTLPSLKGIRAVALGTDGKIYVGAQGEIGFFEPGANGILQYHDLSNLIPESEKDFTDIWDVIPVGKEVFFRSFKRILHLKEGAIKVYSSIFWSYLGLCNGKLVGKAYGKGLQEFSTGKWLPFLQKDTLPEKSQICAIIPIGSDSSLVITKKDGFRLMSGGRLIPFTTPDLQSVAEKNPYAATAIYKNEIAIATSVGGCFIINHKGQIVQRLSKQDGLQNNNVLSVFADKNKNLWLGLDNGIDFVAYNNPIKHIYADYQEHSSGKSAIIYHNNLYIGTSNGLYKAPITSQKDISFIKSNFELAPGIKGQVWSLTEMNDALIIGHNDGLAQLKDETIQVIDGSTGFWNFMPISNASPATLLLAGTYNGINLYNYANGKFTNPSLHSHFESARYIAIDKNIAWAAHPYKGLYKIVLNGGAIKPTLTIYQDKKGILSTNNNHIYKIRNRIVLSNDKGIYEYNPKVDDFEPSAYFSNLLPGAKVQYLKEDVEGNIWFIQDRQLGVIDFSNTKPQIIHFPELNDKIMGNEFDFIYPYNRSNIFVSGEEGFFHINYEAYKKDRASIPILISSVKIINDRDSIIYGGYASAQDKKNEISYAWNSLHFDFSSALFGKQASVEFAYSLQDFDKGWSAWSKKTEKDYTYLSPGTYTFKVKARTGIGQESAVASYQFTILPPWYRTNWAYLAYCILFAAMVYGVHRFQVRKFTAQRKRHEEERKRLEYLNTLQAQKHEEEQKQLMYLHQLERERSEKEIIRLQNERLESEIQVKNSELASTTFNLIQKGEMLVKVKEEFVRMKKTNEVDKESDDYKKIIKMLGEDKMKKDWDHFALHFDKVHSDFLVTLKNQYPNLTPSELKLCAYLRLSLSSKEIAQMMNISIKSVELARYRLRKKLQMQPEENLFSFLLNFHSENDTKM